MIKTGRDDIPNLKGLVDAITKKQSEAEFLDDLKKALQVYVQDVYQLHSTHSIPDSDEKSKPLSQKTSSNQRHALPDTAPDTTDAVGKEKRRYQPSKKDAFFTAKDRTYIETVDELYAVAKYLRKLGGHAKADAEAKVQAARSTRGQAQTMIGAAQYNVFSEKPERMGDGLLEIYKPTRAWSNEKHVAFDDYLLHQLNIDRMTLEGRSREWAAPLTAELETVEKEIGVLTESIKETKKAIRLKETAIHNAKVRRGTVKTAAAKGRWQARLETLTGELSALNGDLKRYEKELKRKLRARKSKKAESSTKKRKNPRKACLEYNTRGISTQTLPSPLYPTPQKKSTPLQKKFLPTVAMPSRTPSTPRRPWMR